MDIAPPPPPCLLSTQVVEWSGHHSGWVCHRGDEAAAQGHTHTTQQV